MHNLNTIAAHFNLARSTVQLWITTGAFTPALIGSSGPGNSTMISTPQAVALGIAAWFRDCPCYNLTAQGQRELFAAFDNVSETELLAAIRGGRTRYAFVHKGRPVLLTPSEQDQPDIEDIYESIRSL